LVCEERAEVDGRDVQEVEDESVALFQARKQDVLCEQYIKMKYPHHDSYTSLPVIGAVATFESK